MPRRRKCDADDDDLDSEVDRTFDALEKERLTNRRGSRRISAVLRTQKDEDEERQKILMDMNARAIEKENPAKDERLLEAMKIAVTKAKQLAARAFQEDLIDRLPSVVEKEPLYQAGSLLDASARIYSFRVDATHSEAYDVRSKLGDKSQPDSDKKDTSTDGDGDDGEGMNSDEGTTSKKEVKDKAKKKGLMDEWNSDSDVDLEDCIAKKNDIYDADDLPVYIDDSSSETDDEQRALKPAEILKKFTNRYDKSHENCIKRRSKVPMVVYDSSELNDTETGTEFCSHLYSKATHNFDEGSSSGLLMQNAVTSKCGRRYMLHNNCRCIREPWNERVEGEDLQEIWNGIEEAEKLGPSNVAGSASSVHDDEHMSTLSRNTSISQETTFMDTTASTSSMQSIQKNVEAVLEKALLESGSKELYRWRRRLQKKFGIDSGQFIALLVHSLRELDPFVRRSFIRQAIIPAKKSYINRIADTKSGLTYAPIADELEPFEESMCWKVCRMRWEEMSDEARSKSLKTLSGEHPTFNYFFARSAEHLSAESDNVLSSLPVFRSIIEIEVPRDIVKMTGDDQKALAGVLDTFRIGRGESLFKKKGDDFGRKIAQIPIATPMRKPEQGWERESTISRERVRSAVPSESINFRSTIPSRMDDVDSETDAGGFTATFDNDADMDAELTPSHMSDFQSTADDARMVASKQVELSEKSESVRVEGSIRSERVDAASAYGDLHFVDERRVAIMAYSIVNDETHWKKRKLDKGEVIGAAKGKPTVRLDKIERKKAKKEEEKEAFEIGDFDNMPLAVIRDRQRQTKRPAVLVKREDEVLKVNRTRVAADLFYKPEQFCRLAHVFSGEWENVRFNRAMSAPIDAKEECLSRMLRQSIREDLDPEEAIKEHMSCFNSYFDDSYSEQRSMSVPCGSEAFDGHNENDLFNEISAQDNDDNDSTLVPTYDIPMVKTTQSFYSEVDSGAEEAEIFGVKYSVRQRRINAPAVKRAIGTILSNAKLDADALNAELSVARQEGFSFLDGLSDLSILNEDSCQGSFLLDGQSDCIELSAEEERLQLREEEEMNDDPTCELRHAEVIVKDFKLAGRHTFSSVLAQLPSYLAGRTADDLSPINAFSVLLHLCNENNLELLQRKDGHGLIMPTEMGDFTIISARQNRVNRKRTASEYR
uniref:Condensin complex subunit 2 n=1 Tax=Setaria digitata TaxID=48799 RepID=A0A915PQQ0_9BILA